MGHVYLTTGLISPTVVRRGNLLSWIMTRSHPLLQIPIGGMPNRTPVALHPALPHHMLGAGVMAQARMAAALDVGTQHGRPVPGDVRGGRAAVVWRPPLLLLRHRLKTQRHGSLLPVTCELRRTVTGMGPMWLRHHLPSHPPSHLCHCLMPQAKFSDGGRRLYGAWSAPGPRRLCPSSGSSTG